MTSKQGCSQDASRTWNEPDKHDTKHLRLTASTLSHGKGAQKAVCCPTSGVTLGKGPNVAGQKVKGRLGGSA